MIRFWDFIAHSAPPLLSLVVELNRSAVDGRCVVESKAWLMPAAVWGAWPMTWRQQGRFAAHSNGAVEDLGFADDTRWKA